MQTEEILNWKNKKKRKGKSRAKKVQKFGDAKHINFFSVLPSPSAELFADRRNFTSLFFLCCLLQSSVVEYLNLLEPSVVEQFICEKVVNFRWSKLCFVCKVLLWMDIEMNRLMGRIERRVTVNCNQSDMKIDRHNFSSTNWSHLSAHNKWLWQKTVLSYVTGNLCYARGKWLLQKRCWQ